jgi:uncharacterized LabA/DUF88 family protein
MSIPNRVAVFIDNSNILLTIKQLQKTGAYWWCSKYCPKYLSSKLSGNREIVYIGFYCAPPPSYLMTGDVADQNRYKLAMKYYGLIEKMKEVTIHYATVNGSRGSLQEKNLDTKLTADLVGMAAQNKYDTAILVSNDADFVSGTVVIQSLGKRVEVIYFKGFGSMELRQKCDVPRKAKPTFFKKIEGFDDSDTYVQRALPLNIS